MKYLIVLLLCFSFSSIGMTKDSEAIIIYENYNAAVSIAEEENKPLLLILSADWCVYCDKLKLEVLTNNEVNPYVVCVIDVDHNKDLAKKFKFKVLPTSIIINEGKETKRKTGFQGKKEYLRWLEL
jgi:thioredoxin-related protein